MTELDMESLARTLYPEWFGESGKLLANYPGQEKHYQDMVRRKAAAVKEDIERQGFQIIRRDSDD